jgi:hypothetical protein
VDCTLTSHLILMARADPCIWYERIATLLITAGLRFMNPADCQVVSVLAYQSNVVQRSVNKWLPSI